MAVTLDIRLGDADYDSALTKTVFNDDWLQRSIHRFLLEGISYGEFFKGCSARSAQDMPLKCVL